MCYDNKVNVVNYLPNVLNFLKCVMFQKLICLWFGDLLL